MARDQLTYLWTSTGVKTLSLGMRPTRVTFTISQKDAGGSDDVIRFSLGTLTDGLSGIWMNCHSLFSEGGLKNTSRYEDRLVSGKESVGGVMTETFRVNFHSFTTSGVKVNVVTKSGSNFIVDVEYET